MSRRTRSRARKSNEEKKQQACYFSHTAEANYTNHRRAFLFDLEFWLEDVAVSRSTGPVDGRPCRRRHQFPIKQKLNRIDNKSKTTANKKTNLSYFELPRRPGHFTRNTKK